ncbi:MAG: hypothetical protein R3C20_08930 [Planctomycetaceae bacterium]
MKLPESNEELAELEIDFPPLPNNTAASAPRPMFDILEYLNMEVGDGAKIKASHLKFLRTAEIYNEAFYWIWQFNDPSSGAKCYVTVSENVGNGSTCVGYDQDYWGLTPEQFIFGSHNRMF